MKIPCEECLVYPTCRQRVTNTSGVTRFAEKERCTKLALYLINSDKSMVNYARVIFGLAPMHVGLDLGRVKVRLRRSVTRWSENK
jgi:hypothetical protein